MSETFLHDLVQAMVATARRLEQSSNVVHQTWATHLQQDAKSLRLLAETWRAA